MRSIKGLRWFFILFFLTGFFNPDGSAYASPPVVNPRQPSEVTAYDLIAAMNSLRMSNGLPALIEDPIVNAVAQSTAEYMAANQMSWHIGDVRGRLAAAGYGGGATVWATENFAMGNMSIDEIMVVWSDADHMRPAVVAAYCHVGAGVALSPNGMYYYVLQAAYTSTNSCGPYNYPSGSTPVPGTSTGSTSAISQWVVPVKIATPDADGKIYHVVQMGQSFWSIAVAYHITIRDLEVWNGLSRANGLRTGQRLFIPSGSTKGYATPTPVGMIVPSTPDADGKIIHTVQPYNSLIAIAEAYQVTVDSILALNGIQVDWPLQIGQKLIISLGRITPSPTPRPLTPLEKLTPASDGNYYHTVQSGETLSWIASLYKITLADLMAWNGLNASSIIRPNQKLLLQVTPPATSTFTPAPPTATRAATLTPTPTPPPPTPTQFPTLADISSTDPAAPASRTGSSKGVLVVGTLAASVGLILFVLAYLKKRST